MKLLATILAFVGAVAVCFGLDVAGAGLSPAIGERVPDSVAATFCGGACQMLSKDDCDAGNVNNGCEIGYKVIGGSNNGETDENDEIDCGASCGSFASDYNDCPG